MSDQTRLMIRNFIIELVVYAVLVVSYFLLVLRFLERPLTELFRSNLPIYAVAALVLIVVQGVFLEQVTSFLVERLGLERME